MTSSHKVTPVSHPKGNSSGATVGLRLTQLSTLHTTPAASTKTIGPSIRVCLAHVGGWIHCDNGFQARGGALGAAGIGTCSGTDAGVQA
jgi:hypothetical protein